MDHVRLDCDWCGSAQSIEFGACQVCLMEYPLETKVLHLTSRERPSERTVRLIADRTIKLPKAGIAD